MIPCSRLRKRMMWSLDWASLDQDVLQLIGWLVLAGDLQDYVSFRAVCKHWSWSTVRPNGRSLRDPRFHPRRWMMLPEGHGLYPGHPDLRGYVRFLNLSTGAFVRAHLPLLDDHVILDSVDGLLLLHRDHDTTIRVLHPFTGEVADLPPLASLVPQMKNLDRYPTETTKRGLLMTLSASVSVSFTGSIIVMLFFPVLHHVAYATTGDQRWTLSALNLWRPVVSFHGKFYGFRKVFGVRKVHIYQIDPPGPDGTGPSQVKIAECPLDEFRYARHLIECGSDLLVVAYTNASRTKLLVYRLADLVSGKFVPITSIGDHALFLGERCFSVSLSTNKGSKGFPSIPPNSIISLNRVSDPDSGTVFRFAEYHLDTGIWTPAGDGDIMQRPPPSPHMLIHHICACCHPKYWNKGIMFCRKTKPAWLVKSRLRYAA